MNRRRAVTPKQYIEMKRRRNARRIAAIVLSCAILISIVHVLPREKDVPTFEPAIAQPQPAPSIVQVVKPENEPITEAPEPEEIVVEDVEVEEEEIVEEDPCPYTDEEIDLIALVTMAEAEGESELGKRLVIDTVLNRVEAEDRFPDTVHGVIYQPNQFTSMWNGRVDRCEVREDICQLVREEITDRTNDECLYFRMYRYHSFGTPLFQEGCHYFSGC